MNTPRKLFILLLAVTVTACGSAATPTATPDFAPTTAPSATVAPPTLLLVVPPDADPALATAAAEVAAAYATERGLVFEQRAVLDAASVTPNVTKIAFFPNAGFDPSLITSASLVAIGECEASAANVIAICLSGSASEQAAFIAGYVAAITADDWRVGMLYSPSSTVLADDFRAGAEYYCGSCIPLAPPPGEFPLAAQAGDAANWQTAADELLLNFTRVVYLAPEMAISDAATYLANFGVLFVSTGPPPEALAGNWIASVSADPVAALREQLPVALEGQQAASASSLALTNVNAAYISEARLGHIQAVIADLLAGFILLPVD